MLFVADESVDFTIVQFLRAEGLDVLAIAEQHPSISDEDVLQIAVKRNAVLLTEDKDFGELVFRFGLLHRGIILLRLSGIAPQDKAALCGKAIFNNMVHLADAFAVFDGEKMRIRKM